MPSWSQPQILLRQGKMEGWDAWAPVYSGHRVWPRKSKRIFRWRCSTHRPRLPRPYLYPPRSVPPLPIAPPSPSSSSIHLLLVLSRSHSLSHRALVLSAERRYGVACYRSRRYFLVSRYALFLDLFRLILLSRLESRVLSDLTPTICLWFCFLLFCYLLEGNEKSIVRRPRIWMFLL